MASLIRTICSIWTDEKNTWLNELDLFTVSFFDPARLHSMIARYTIFDEDNSRMIVMRPYQVHAVEAILNKPKIILIKMDIFGILQDPERLSHHLKQRVY